MVPSSHVWANASFLPLFSADHDPVQHPEPQAPVDDVRPVVELLLQLLGLAQRWVVGQRQLLQRRELGEVAEAAEVGHAVVVEGESGEARREVTLAAGEARQAVLVEE